ncbi:MAG: Uncharacterized protein Athens071425_524 [Parcubacteria group bacterium Athens0714_25]|nr:MAG: Uncharacterized protein Athens071425_524 [Parcubacteria group bacterium Athens0714_25]
MEQDILEKFKQQDEKLEQIFVSVEKTRKYFLWTMIISIGAVLLPLIGLIAIIPWFLSTMSSAYSGLGL